MSKFSPDIGIVWGANSASMPDYPYYVQFPGDWERTPFRSQEGAKGAALQMQRSLQSQGVAAFVGRKDLKPIQLA